MTQPTLSLVREQAADVIATFYEAILSAGPDGIPNGHVYARVMDMVSLPVYEEIISILKQAQLVRESGHVLYAIPKTERVMR